MAPAALRRAGWPVLALAAAGVLVALAIHGRRPGAGFARYEPNGVMVDVALSEVSAVEVVREGRRLRMVRDDGGGWRTVGSPRAGGVSSEVVERGLRFLHGSAPQRVIAPEEMAGTPLAQIGLAPPRLVVSVLTRSGLTFVVEFGAPNPQGLAHYARVAGRRELLLLNRYVGDTWQEVAAP